MPLNFLSKIICDSVASTVVIGRSMSFAMCTICTCRVRACARVYVFGTRLMSFPRFETAVCVHVCVRGWMHACVRNCVNAFVSATSLPPTLHRLQLTHSPPLSFSSRHARARLIFVPPAPPTHTQHTCEKGSIKRDKLFSKSLSYRVSKWNFVTGSSLSSFGYFAMVNMSLASERSLYASAIARIDSSSVEEPENTHTQTHLFMVYNGILDNGTM